MSINSSKKIVDTIVKVVRNNNKLMLYGALLVDTNIPKKIICLDKLKSIDLFTMYLGSTTNIDKYRTRFNYINEDE